MSNELLVARMRAFKFSEMNLSFKDDESYLPASKQIKGLHAPLWIRVSGGFSALIVLAGVPILFPRVRLMDWVLNNYGLCFTIWVIAICALIAAMAIESKFTDRRWLLFAKANDLELVKPGSDLPGNLKTNTGVSLGFSLNTSVGKNVTFGTCSGWFDVESKWPVGGYSADESFESILFLRVKLPAFAGPIKYFGPRRPVDFGDLPPMSDKAQISLTSLAARYSVVIGQGSIVVSHAKSSGISVTDSLEYTDLSLDSRWLLFSKLISGKLSDVVEGVPNGQLVA